MVRNEWRKFGGIPITEKLKALHRPLRIWNFGNIDANIRKFEDDQMKIQIKIDGGNDDACNISRLITVEAQLSKWPDRKANFWQQMSRDRWIKGGDRNTKYYHAMALGTKRFKPINLIRDGGRVFKRPRAIKIAILKSYKGLYRQEPKRRVHLDSTMLPKIATEQLDALERRPTMEEISLAVQECDALKALGCDSFNFKFVKELWMDIRQEVCDFILEFFDTRRLPKEVNCTWVTLIPKIEGASEIKDFRPISMVGCLYKNIAKILAKRLSKVLPDLIGETQSAFVKNRQILDGALIANEIVWWSKKSKQRIALLKMDSNKPMILLDGISWRRRCLEWDLETNGLIGSWNV